MKEYTKPYIEEELIELEDICAGSGFNEPEEDWGGDDDTIILK